MIGSFEKEIYPEYPGLTSDDIWFGNPCRRRIRFNFDLKCLFYGQQVFFFLSQALEVAPASLDQRERNEQITSNAFLHLSDNWLLVYINTYSWGQGNQFGRGQTVPCVILMHHLFMLSAMPLDDEMSRWLVAGRTEWLVQHRSRPKCHPPTHPGQARKAMNKTPVILLTTEFKLSLFNMA